MGINLWQCTHCTLQQNTTAHHFSPTYTSTFILGVLKRPNMNDQQQELIHLIVLDSYPNSKYYIYIYICPFCFLFHFKRKWFCLNWGHFLIFGLLKTIINLLLHQNRNPKILISPERKAGKWGRENWLTKPLFLTLSVFTALFQSYIINCLEDIALSNIIGNGFAPLICLEKGTITCK